MNSVATVFLVCLSVCLSAAEHLQRVVLLHAGAGPEDHYRQKSWPCYKIWSRLQKSWPGVVDRWSIDGCGLEMIKIIGFPLVLQGF